MTKTATRVIGDYNIIPEGIHPDGQMSLIFQPIDMMTYWRRCGLSANFVAGFYSYCFQSSESKSNSLSTIINELLENASKFSKAKDGKIEVDLKHYGNLLKVEISNITSKSLKDNFESFVEKLSPDNVEELYFHNLETKASNDPKSGLGILMMLKDYPVRFGYSFKEIDSDSYEIIVRAVINIEEL
jgi:hypothetical protein